MAGVLALNPLRGPPAENVSVKGNRTLHVISEPSFPFVFVSKKKKVSPLVGKTFRDGGFCCWEQGGGNQFTGRRKGKQTTPKQKLDERPVPPIKGKSRETTKSRRDDQVRRERLSRPPLRRGGRVPTRGQAKDTSAKQKMVAGRHRHRLPPCPRPPFCFLF